MNRYRGVLKLLLLGMLTLIGWSNVLASTDWNHTLILSEAETTDHSNLPGHNFSSFFFSIGALMSDSASSVSVSDIDSQLAQNSPEGFHYYMNVSDFVIKDSGGYTQYSTGVSGDLLDASFTTHGLMAGSYYTRVFDGFADGEIYNGTVSAVPLLMAAWLFGAALVGFVVFSARCSV
jgi:hypothetical protein